MVGPTRGIGLGYQRKLGLELESSERLTKTEIEHLRILKLATVFLGFYNERKAAYFVEEIKETEKTQIELTI